MLVVNPIPGAYALDAREMDSTVELAITEMNRLGISGKETTPFLLSRVAEQTEGASLTANIELVLSNAKVAAETAVEYSRLLINQAP